MITYVFPGQGSQKKGMGAEFFDEYREFVAEANKILGYSINELCLLDPENKLNNTEYTQPALYVINALSYIDRVKKTGVVPDYVAGHSLGEYNALFAAGAYDFATGLAIIKRRGELMAKATGGGMAAIIGLTDQKIKEVLEKENLNNISVANYNSPLQIVVSGPTEEVKAAKPYFETAGAKGYIPLNVSGAFHSKYMEKFKLELEEYLELFKFSELKIPVISNVYAKEYTTGSIKETLAKQLVSSVRWTDSIKYLMDKGDMKFEQIGPGNVLTSLINNIKKES